MPEQAKPSARTSRSLRRRHTTTRPLIPGTNGRNPEAFWDLHGGSLYTLACALFGDAQAAERACAVAMGDLYSPKNPKTETPPDEITLRVAAGCIYHHYRDGYIEAPAHRTITTPPEMVRFSDLAPNQRDVLALCVFGGHTYHQAATRVGMEADAAAIMVRSGLHALAVCN